MRLSSTGSALVAKAGGAVSIDGATPAGLSTVTAAGGWHWLDDDTAVGLGDTGGAVALLQYVVSTDTLSTLDAAVSDASVAGGGTWGVYEAATGVRTNLPVLGTLAAAALADASPSGQLALILAATTSRGLRVFDDTGTELVTVDAELATTVVRLRNDRLAYVDAQGWHLRDVTTNEAESLAQRIDATPTVLIPVELTGGTLVVVELTARLTLRRPGDPRGYVLDTGTVVEPDAIEVSPGVVRVGWANNASQAATTLVLLDVTVASGAASRGTVSGGAIVWAAATTLPVAPLPAVSNTAATNISLDALLRQEMDDGKTRLVSRQWAPWFKAVDRLLSQPIDLSRVIGVLAEANGGTGNTSGTGEVADAFGTIAVAGETAVSAQVPGDVLTLVEGLGILLATSAVARTVTVTAKTHTVRKTADETVNNSAALQDDDHLALAVAANEVWLVELFLLVETNTTADVKIGWTAPGAATLQWGSGEWTTVAAAAAATALLGVGATLSCGGSTGTQGIHLVGILATGANAGTLQLQWAQDTADASNTKVLTNSLLRATVLTG